jgi:hypothetical protein
MKSLEFDNTFVTIPNRAGRWTKVSQLNRGVWFFVSVDTIIFTQIDDAVKSSKMTTRFGVCLETETDPKKISFYGNAGDYLISDRFGNLNISSPENYYKVSSVLLTKK